MYLKVFLVAFGYFFEIHDTFWYLIVLFGTWGNFTVPEYTFAYFGVLLDPRILIGNQVKNYGQQQLTHEQHNCSLMNR